MRRDLPPMDVAARLGRLRDAVEGCGCDGFLVTNLVNIRYLTGFTGSAGMLLVRECDAVLVSDGRYATQAAEELAAVGVVASVETAPAAQQRDLVSGAAEGVRRLGLEAQSVTWARQRALAEWFAATELVATDGVVEQLRRTKDDGEVARIAEAARVADEALASVRPLLDGVSEADFALELDFSMRRLGADGVAFETIVAAGPNAAKPHHRPSTREMHAGEAVVVDFGALVDGYRSDMTRTLGAAADAVLARAWAAVAEAQEAGVAAVAAGSLAADVDRACRETITHHGFGDAFVHPTGHGVGLDIHEAPAVSATSTDTLSTGHVLTVEPGVYLPDIGGVRIEDTVVVTEGGCLPLTHAPKERPELSP